MTLQVLVATMNQMDHTLLEKMNIQTDAIVGNQCSENFIENFEWNGHRITYLNFAEKGVGLNRNNALMRAEADICLFADDDMVYEDGYAEKVIYAFEQNPKADVLIFNLRESNKITNSRYVIKEKMRVHRLNYLRYGTARVAIRLKSIKENAIYFNQLFGGGTTYCHGEDNLFLTACLNSKLKIIAIPETIACLTEERESTWNNGYDKKYLKDQGILYRTISRRWWKLLCLQDAIRRRKSYNMAPWDAYLLMIQGASQ